MCFSRQASKLLTRCVDEATMAGQRDVRPTISFEPLKASARA